MAQLVKNPPGMQDTWVQSLGWEGKGILQYSVFWPGEFHAWYSSWGSKELDMAK